jgi:hypothetical protein
VAHHRQEVALRTIGRLGFAPRAFRLRTSRLGLRHRLLQPTIRSGQRVCHVLSVRRPPFELASCFAHLPGHLVKTCRQPANLVIARHRYQSLIGSHRDLVRRRR